MPHPDAPHDPSFQPPETPRVLLVDDHPLIRQAVKDLLRFEMKLAVCGEAGDADAAMELLKTTRPHLVLLDLSLGQRDGLALIPSMLQALPGVRILVLSMYDASLFAQRSIRGGAHGYVQKREATETIARAIRTVLSGQIYLPNSREDGDEQISEPSHRPAGGGAKYPFASSADIRLLPGFTNGRKKLRPA